MLRKFKMGGVIFASLLMASSCQNDEMVYQNADRQMFQLTVSRNLDSRTVLEKENEGYQTKWSSGDKIYVTSADGKTTGVLTLTSDPGYNTGTFSGFVFGNPSDLAYSVFPVPSNKVVDLNNPDEGQLDAPMVATISGSTASFQNACAMVLLDIDGLPENATVSVSADDIMTQAAFDASTGTLNPVSTSASKVTISGTEANVPVFVPLFINSTITEYDLTVSVNGKECNIDDVTLTTNKLSVSDIPELMYTTVGDNEYLIKVVETTENLPAEEVLAVGGSVVISEAPSDGTLAIGASEAGVPTVITLDYEVSTLNITAVKDSTPNQTIKVIVAGGVTDQITVTADETLTVELVYQVGDAEQMNTLFENLTDAASGNTSVEFASDIDLTDEDWTPVYVEGYQGADVITIDGKGCVITGLNAPLFAGGFAGGSGIVIKNLSIDQSTIVSTNTTGSGAFIEASDSQAKIELVNCKLTNSSVSGSRTGGLVGWTSGYSNEKDGPVKSYITFTDCVVDRCTITGSSVGGLNGHAGASDWTYTTIENCTVTNCKLNSTDDGDWRVGVAVGTANVGEVTITNLTESGNTLTQTGKTAPTGDKRNYYGRFVPGTTGKLTIDGVEIKIIAE